MSLSASFEDIALSRAQLRRVDELAVSRYGMHPLVLMENAGRSATDYLETLYGNGCDVLIVCGTGNNGGDGCVMARHLHNARWRVRVLVTGTVERMSADLKANWAIVDAMGLDRLASDDSAAWERFLTGSGRKSLVIDALLGTGFSGDVREPVASLIHTINDMTKQACTAIDVPSGLDADTGMPSNATIRAHDTITFVAEKIGFRAAQAADYVGDLYVGSIGVPRELIADVAAGRA